MAWTSLGGEIMYVEATKMDGDGQLTLTGQLGDVMKESAQLALNWVRTHAAKVQTNSRCQGARGSMNPLLPRFSNFHMFNTGTTRFL